ncbi:hypothetical protein AGMMS49975_22750 [Clostridia bacterium]|nr:hypothetical protein AGMMS49975_22750 [Clostridia bacterium]
MKPVMKSVTVTNNNAELVDFAQTVDFAPLFDHIRVFAGVACEFYAPEIYTIRGEVFIGFMSEDITAQAGVFAAVLERCCIGSFNNGVNRRSDKGELCYWVNVSLKYDHKNGGSNGMELLLADYIGGNWRFRDVGQRREGRGLV